mgnify:CR=1 FL=1
MAVPSPHSETDHSMTMPDDDEHLHELTHDDKGPPLYDMNLKRTFLLFISEILIAKTLGSSFISLSLTEGL